ncbi:MAG: hypothetical protein DYG94_09105 [Leptolyngbya sp. PLA3]|nr:MAG: hypothetical protein EDM82_02690 [Cyanobacteria bacterium CYA]MCE7968889.1 hypothetical protein [Leptolyngbya sp. PL-A3]
MQLQLANLTRPARPSQATSEGASHERAIRRWEDTDVLSKGQLIEQILVLNPGATLEFLADFSVNELSQYLNHLLWLQQPRTGGAWWARPGDSPAVVVRDRNY